MYRFTFCHCFSLFRGWVHSPSPCPPIDTVRKQMEKFQMISGFLSDWWTEEWWAESDLWRDTCWHLRWAGRGCGRASTGSRLLRTWWWWCNVPSCRERRTLCTSRPGCPVCSPSLVFLQDPASTRMWDEKCVYRHQHIILSIKVLHTTGLLPGTIVCVLDLKYLKLFVIKHDI